MFDLYEIHKITTKEAKDYIKTHHYSHGCHNGPSPCYGLFVGNSLIGVLMFATPCSENVRSSVFGEEYKNHVTELHRLHIKDTLDGKIVPKNTESWFISRCLKSLKRDKPKIWAVLSFADSTEGHNGTIYKATNAYFCGTTSKSTFFFDTQGRLRHPRQCGVNITKDEAKSRGWDVVKRDSKYRYLFLLPNSKSHRKKLLNMCKYTEELEGEDQDDS